MKKFRNTICFVLVIFTLLLSVSTAETIHDIPKIYINDVPVVFLDKEGAAINPVIVDDELYVPLTSLLDMLQVSYVQDGGFIQISVSGEIIEGVSSTSSGIKLSDFQSMVAAEIYEKCEFVQIESDEGTIYAYPVDKDYGITVYVDKQEMITKVIFEKTFDHESNITYLDSMNFYKFSKAMSNITTEVPIMHFPVLGFINDSASLLMYITDNSEDNPYEKIFDCNGETAAENKWEYTLITNEEERTAKLEFNYIGE